MLETNWNESSCIGVPQIDEDHKKLIQILGQIKEHQHDNVKSEAISTILDQLTEFSSRHFRNEDEYMLKVGFPGYQAHKEQHRQFKEKIAALWFDVMNHKETVPQDIYNYLSDWVTNHFLDFDKELRTFLETKKGYHKTA